MKYTLAQTMNRSLRWLLALGAAAAVGVQGTYLYKFGPGAWLTLSSDPAVWGQYGDYIGGLLNPIFSSLAFGGLVVTIVLQARQIDEARRSSELEEMQRVQSTIAGRIDHLLTSQVIVNTNEYKNLHRFADNPQTVFELVASLGTMVLSVPEEGETNWLKWAWDDITAEGLKKALDAQTVPLRLEFESLSYMLLQYEMHQGSQVVMDFYKYRFTAVLVWLDALGLLNVHHQVQKFFNPKEHRPHMKPETK
ncbi:hypothetical protein [Variovorax paradoxus]|uniref:hypothetical protein n=1 Tax=Variovorax paradoxus TaxID=34073 RepID=UPI00277DD50E|nr:hypothetical protein [Variovorax paradoxus]MDP9929463.1 hypothetical protein [Variovorax paradoxus]